MSIGEKIYHIIYAWVNTALAISLITLTCEIESQWMKVVLCFISAMPIVAAICHIRQIPLASESETKGERK